MYVNILASQSQLLCVDNADDDTWYEILEDEADEGIDDPALRGLPVLW